MDFIYFLENKNSSKSVNKIPFIFKKNICIFDPNKSPFYLLKQPLITKPVLQNVSKIETLPPNTIEPKIYIFSKSHLTLMATPYHLGCMHPISPASSQSSLQTCRELVVAALKVVPKACVVCCRPFSHRHM